MSQTIRETASNRRVSQDALLTNLTVSDNCILPCLDDRINSLISTQVTQISQNISSNPYLVSEVTITRDELYGTAPTFTVPSGTTPIFGYPSTVSVDANSQPNPNEGLITLVPAPGANKLIVPQIIEVVAHQDSDPNASYAEGGLPNPGAAPDLIFQLSNRYPTKTDNQSKISGQEVISARFEDNTNIPGGGIANNDVKFVNELACLSLSMQGGLGSVNTGVPLISSAQAVNNFSFSTRVFLSASNIFPAIEGVKLQVGTYPIGPLGNQVRGFDFSPVNQPLTLYVDQPLAQNKGRDFTVRVHYNIVPSLD